MRKWYVLLLTLAVFLLLNTAGLTQSTEQDVNVDAGRDYEEVFSAGSTNDVVYIDWLSPKATNEFPGVAWFLGAYRFDDGSLAADLNRDSLTNNLRYAIHYSEGRAGASRSAALNSVIFLDLLDTNGIILAESEDLLTSSNVVHYVIAAGQTNDAVLLINVPAAEYPDAAILQLRLEVGTRSESAERIASGSDSSCVIVESLLYIDEDGDFFTATEERRRGTSDYIFDGAGGSISNYYDWINGNHSGSLTNNPSPPSPPPPPSPLPPDELKIIYVDQAIGNDTFTGRAPAIAAHKKGPKKTVHGGLSIAEPADMMIIKSGNYNENLDISGKDVQVRIEGNVRL